MKLPPDFQFPPGTKSLTVNLAALMPPPAPAAALAAAPAAIAEPPARPSKYGNRRTEYNGRAYDSKGEAGLAADLDRRKAAGEILEWFPQVLVDLGGIPFRVDFLVVGLGETWAEDFKGAITQRTRDVVRLWRRRMRIRLRLVFKDRTEDIEPEWRAARGV